MKYQYVFKKIFKISAINRNREVKLRPFCHRIFQAYNKKAGIKKVVCKKIKVQTKRIKVERDKDNGKAIFEISFNYGKYDDIKQICENRYRN